MTITRRTTFRPLLSLLSVAAAAAPLLAQPTPAAPPAPSPAPTAAPTPRRDVQTYRSHIEFLANPFMEGRGPGTRGNQIASDYIEACFKRLNLSPPINPWPRRQPGDPVIQPPSNLMSLFGYRQAFTAGSRAELASAELDDTRLAAKGNVFERTEHDYTVLGFSGPGPVEAPLAFVGYAIQKGGPDKSFSTYPETPDDHSLAGRIAVMFRFEPMNETGESLWRKKEDTLWTAAAALPEKIQSAVKHGAAGILLVNPPGCSDSRADKLESTEGSSRWTQPQDVPVFMMSSRAAERLLQTHDPEHRTIAQWRQLADTKPGITFLDDGKAIMSAKIDRSPRTTWNIAATLPGRGTLASQYIIIGAHYDHVGYGYTGGSRSDEYGIVHPGADDNASGASGLLLAAELLKKNYDAAPKDANLRSIMFVAFSAEEMGLIGSREFMKTCPIEARNINAMLNMDMIGRLRDNHLEVSGTGTAQGFADLLKPRFDASGLSIAQSPGGRGPSDHATFYGAGIPVLHFFTGQHEQYHTPRDTTDLINSEGAVKVVDLVCSIAQSLATRPEQLTFTSTDKTPGKPDEPAGPTLGGLKVRFGVAPANYADGEAGVLVGEVYPGTCAAEAGIQSQDRLIRWNGKDIGDVASWMTFLAQHKPGDTADVDIKRKGEELRVRVTLKSRDQAPK